MNFDGVIFDVDGTLWDPTDVAAVGFARGVGRATGTEPALTGEGMRKIFGRPMQEIADVLMPDVSPDERREAFPIVLEEEEKTLRALRPQAFPGVVETAAALSEHLPLFIVTNGQKGYAEICLESTGLTPYFTAHFCPEDTGLTKGENIILIRERYGLERACYVGDTTLDEQAAALAGVPFIYAAYGFGTAEAPAYTIHSFPDLLHIVLDDETKGR